MQQKDNQYYSRNNNSCEIDGLRTRLKALECLTDRPAELIALVDDLQTRLRSLEERRPRGSCGYFVLFAVVWMVMIVFLPTFFAWHSGNVSELWGIDWATRTAPLMPFATRIWGWGEKVLRPSSLAIFTLVCLPTLWFFQRCLLKERSVSLLIFCCLLVLTAVFMFILCGLRLITMTVS